MGLKLPAVVIMTDSESLLASMNSLHNGKDKSVLVAVKSLRELLVERAVEAGFVAGKENPADDLTKPTHCVGVLSMLIRLSV